MTIQIIVAALAVIGSTIKLIVWFKARSAAKNQLIAEQAPGEIAGLQAALQKTNEEDARHESALSEISAGVSDDRASELLSRRKPEAAKIPRPKLSVVRKSRRSK